MKMFDVAMSRRGSSSPKIRTFFLALASAALAACGGGGGGSSVPTPTPTVSGKITFDSVPISSVTNGLNFAATTQAPARGIVVEALDAANTSSAALASGTTDSAGNYVLTVPSNTSIIIRAKAQMLATGTGASWNFKVLNNANGDALYVLDSPAAFNTGTANVANKNYNAASGWNGTTYNGTRAAAPFAILDTIYQAVQLIETTQPQTSLPALNMYWSSSNNAAPSFCPMTGEINTTAFHTADGIQTNCVSQTESSGGIYVLGDYANGDGDTDEFDTHVIAHEFGHYIEHNFSRADSQGGNHSAGNKLDMRVAMSEGWGNAFSGMATNDPVYRDSQFQNGVPVGFFFDLRTTNQADPAGWYSEGSVQHVLWSLFSAPTNLGFTPILQALQGKQKTTPAFTSIFSFLDALETVAPASTSSINQLANANGINSVDPFGAGETNSGGDSSVLPIYATTAVPICSSAANGTYNKLGTRKFFKIVTASAGTVTISLNAAANGSGTVAATDPDFLLWSAGTLKIDGTQATTTTETASASLPAGTYVLEVYDYAYNNPSNSTPFNNGPHCMTVSITTPP